MTDKYLIIKTNAFIQKLKEKYTNIITMCIKDDPGNLRIGFQSWGPKHKIILLIGNKNKDSLWINNVEFNTNVSNNGFIKSDTFNKEFEDLCIIIDNLLIDFNII